MGVEKCPGRGKVALALGSGDQATVRRCSGNEQLGGRRTSDDVPALGAQPPLFLCLSSSPTALCTVGWTWTGEHLWSR